MMRLLLLLFLGLAVASLRAEGPKATASPDGHYVFVMQPAPQSQAQSAARGTLYELGPNGSLEPRWTTSGWYAPEIVVANDGVHIVGLNPWPEGEEPDATVGVAFYRSGQLIKSYSIKDLVKEKKAVRGSLSHYRWLAEHATQQPRLEEKTFKLITIDGTLYHFDLDTGAITKSTAVRLFRR